MPRVGTDRPTDTVGRFNSSGLMADEEGTIGRKIVVGERTGLGEVRPHLGHLPPSSVARSPPVGGWDREASNSCRVPPQSVTYDRNRA